MVINCTINMFISYSFSYFNAIGIYPRALYKNPETLGGTASTAGLNTTVVKVDLGLFTKIHKYLFLFMKSHNYKKNNCNKKIKCLYTHIFHFILPFLEFQCILKSIPIKMLTLIMFQILF